ncbi:MAG: FprA family A-type flavoprotein [Planctomycetota bacterium]|nr:FprA family A-type flavoprotein [Planctomycetota bacterium]
MRQLKANVYAVGAIDWDRKLFDELIPLPDGTSYNAYLIKGSEKTALLDTVDPTKTNVLIDNLVKSGAAKIDYIVSHHAEQDHCGSIPEILLLYPEALVVTNAKCRDMLMDLLHIEEGKFITIEDGQTLSLGDKTMQFVFIPWVHWPETMGTYLKEDKIFFPCDLFGSHLATSSLFVDDQATVYEAAKRYYAEIMMPFRGPIKKNLEKMKQLQIEMIAPSHGPVVDKPEFIINAYKDWVSDDVKNEVVLPYVSMHESTRKMVEHLVDSLIERGITVRQFNLTTVDIGKLAMALVDAATIIIGSPTVLTGAHPKAAYACILANSLRPKAKFASVIGSYGWGGKMVEQIAGLLANLKVEIIEPVIAKGSPKDSDFTALDNLADKIAAKHKELKIAK